MSNPPSTVNAQLRDSNTLIRVTWTSMFGATGYDVQKQINGGNWNNFFTNRQTETFDDRSLSPGNSYRYRVRTRYRTASGLIATTTYRNSNTIFVPLPIPATPGSISVSRRSELDQLDVSWSSVSFATSYTLQLSDNFGRSWSGVTTISGTSRRVTGLRRGNTYRFRVRANNNSGSSGYRTSGDTTLRPFKPSSATATISGSTSIRLEWPAANGATGYDVERRQNGGGWIRVTNNTSSRSINYTGLARGANHQFRVRSRNGGGVSPTWEDSNTVFLPFPPPSAPSSASISKSKRDVTISLGTASAPAGTSILRYEIQIRQEGGSYGSTRTVSTSNRSTTYTGLNPGATYRGRGRAIGEGGAGDWTTSGTVSISPPPSAPASLSLTKNKRDITAVSGTASAASDVTISSYTFQLRASTNGGATWGAWGSNRTTNTTNRVVTYTNLDPATTYQVRSRAESDFNSGAWRESNTVTISPPPDPPSTISAIRSVRDVTVSLGLSSAASDVTISAYEIQTRESTNDGATWGAWGTTRTVPINNRTTTYTTLNYLSTYQFRGRALSDFNPGGYRTSGTVFVPGLPQAPTQLITVRAGTSILVSIAPPSDTGRTPILSYILQRRVSPDKGATWGPWTFVENVPAAQSAVLDRDFELQKSYQYRAKSVNEMGESDLFTESPVEYIPKVVEIYNSQNRSFRNPIDYKRYNATMNDWVGLSIAKKRISGVWVDLE